MKLPLQKHIFLTIWIKTKSKNSVIISRPIRLKHPKIQSFWRWLFVLSIFANIILWRPKWSPWKWSRHKSWWSKESRSHATWWHRAIVVWIRMAVVIGWWWQWPKPWSILSRWLVSIVWMTIVHWGMHRVGLHVWLWHVCRMRHLCIILNGRKTGKNSKRRFSNEWCDFTRFVITGTTMICGWLL